MKHVAILIGVICVLLSACRNSHTSAEVDSTTKEATSLVDLVKSYELNRPKVIAEVVSDLQLSSEVVARCSQRGCQLNFRIEREDLALTFYLDDPDAGRRDYEVKVIGVEIYRDGKSLALTRVPSAE